MKNKSEQKSGNKALSTNILLLLGAIIALLSIVFAVQNAEPIQVEFFKWSFTLPLALLVVASISVGILLTAVFSLPTWWKKSRQIARLQKELKNTPPMVTDNDHSPTPADPSAE